MKAFTLYYYMKTRSNGLHESMKTVDNQLQIDADLKSTAAE